jgi:hypothetical protein
MFQAVLCGYVGKLSPPASLETQKTLSIVFFFLSAEREERKKQRPFGNLLR